MYNQIRNLTVTCALSLALTGCPSYFYSQVPEPFTSNAQTSALDNQNYQEKLQKMVDTKFPHASIKVTSSHFNVLIAGQVASKYTKNAIVKFIGQQDFVCKVYDYTTITSHPSYSTSSSVVSDVQLRLYKEPDISSDRITVTYVDGVVYLMGTNLGNLTHYALAIKGIYTIKGVHRVVDLVVPGKQDYYSDK